MAGPPQQSATAKFVPSRRPDVGGSFFGLTAAGGEFPITTQ